MPKRVHRHAQKSAQPRCFILEIPNELLSIILGKISIFYLLKNVAPTCRHMRNIIEHSPNVWRQVDLTKTSRTSDRVLFQIAKRTKGRTKWLKLPHYGLFHQDLLSYRIAQDFCHLQRLDLKYLLNIDWASLGLAIGKLKNLRILKSPHINLDFIEHAYGGLTSLRRLSVTIYERRQMFEQADDPYPLYHQELLLSLANAISKNVNLERLSIWGVDCNEEAFFDIIKTRLHKLSIIKIGSNKELAPDSYLEEGLPLQPSKGINALAPTQCIRDLNHNIATDNNSIFSTLKAISICRPPTIDEALSLGFLAKHLSSFTFLWNSKPRIRDLHWGTEYEQKTLQSDLGIVIHNCNNLRHIFVKGRPCDDFLICLATHENAYNLHDLQIQDATNISSRAWCQFFSQGILQAKTKPDVQLRNLSLIRGPITYNQPYKNMVENAKQLRKIHYHIPHCQAQIVLTSHYARILQEKHILDIKIAKVSTCLIKTFTFPIR